MGIKITPLISTLFPRDDFNLDELANVIENNRDFSTKNLEVKKDELGPQIIIKAEDEDGIINATKHLTKVYKQNPHLKSKIYSGLKLEENTDKLLIAYLASESELSTPEIDGERSFGHNLIADKILYKLREIDRKINRGITIEIKRSNKEKDKNYTLLDSIKKHKKAIATLAATAALGSCIVYPSLIKGRITFDPYLTINHLSQIAANTYPLLSRNLSYVPYLIPTLKIEDEDDEKKKSRKRKILKYGLPIALASWFSLDLLNRYIIIPSINLESLGPFKLNIRTPSIKVPGPINSVKTLLYSTATGLDWNRSVDLALRTDTLNFLGGIFGQKTEFSKAISIYHQLDGGKDKNVYNLVRFFLGDGKISPNEVNSIDYYLRVRDNLFPKELLPYWPLEERGEIAYDFCRQLLADGQITDEEKNIAGLMLNFRRPMISVRGIQKGIILDPYKDHDKDGFSTMEELLKDRNYLNPLETPLTNDSEVYAIFLAGGEGYGQEIPFIFNHLARKYGIPKDHVKILLGSGIYQYTGIDPTTGKEYISERRMYYFPELKGNLIKDYPPMDNIERNVRKVDVIEEIEKFLQLSDSNDVVYIHNSSEGPGFKIFLGIPGSYEMIRIPEMVDIMKSTPREGKLILVNDTCGAEWYIKTLKEAMIREGSPLKDYVGIGAVREGELSL